MIEAASVFAARAEWKVAHHLRHFIRSDGSDHREPAFAPFHREAHREVVTGVVIWITGNADILRDEGPTCCQRKGLRS